MILGAVLAKAAALHDEGERELFFCNHNKNDFSPHDRVESAVAEPKLDQAYRACGLTYLSHFNVG